MPFSQMGQLCGKLNFPVLPVRVHAPQIYTLKTNGCACMCVCVRAYMRACECTCVLCDGTISDTAS